MPKVLETYSALRNMRDAVNNGKGLSAQEVADRLVLLINQMGVEESPKSHAWILRIEERGTRDRYITKGLAKIYNKPEEVVAAAARDLLNKNNLL